MSATRKSDGETLTDEVSMHAKIQNIPVISWEGTAQGIDGKETAYIAAPGEYSDVFGVGSKNNNYDAIAAAGGSFNSLLDEMEQTYTYPEGVYFAESVVASDYGLDGVEKGGTNIAEYKTAEETLTDGTTVRTYVYNPLLTITVEEKPQGGGTVKFSFTKTAFLHASGYPNLVSYFRARTAEDPGHPEWKYYSREEPIVKLRISGWLKRNHEEPKNLATMVYTRILIFDTGDKKDIDLGGPYTITRVDLMNGKLEANDEAGMGITVDEMIGSGRVTSRLEYSNTTFYYENLTPEKVQVTGVQMHGKNIRNVVVNTVNGENLVIPDSAIGNNTSQYEGIYLTKKALADAGMQEGDYIRSVRFTGTVVQGTYFDKYAYGCFAYDGHFVEGLAEGETVTGVLRLLNDLPEDYVATPDDKYAEYGSRREDIMEPLPGNKSEAQLITKTGWSNTGVGRAAAFVGAEDRPEATLSTFYPNDDMYFTAYVNGGIDVYTSDTIASPILIITLPEEAPLDTEYGVTAKAAAGSGRGAEVKMELLSKTTEVRSEDDVERKYTVYRYEVKDPTQLVGLEHSNCGGWSSVFIYAKAHVNQNCPETNLKLTDVIRWDLRRTAENASSDVNYVYADTTARAGHGSDYALAAAGASFAIKPLIGLNMDLSLRAVFDANYHTYNGQKDSVSLVQPTRTAYMKLEYESTSLSDYYKNTSILLPIPKKGKDYKKYFENVALVSPGDHDGEEEYTKKFDFSFYLNEYPKMVATDDSGVTWTTYYAIATDGAAASNSISKNDYSSESGLDDWEPAMKIDTDGEHLVWLTEDALRARHEFSTQKEALDDVVMLKFVANDNIEPGKTGEAVITVRVDESAEEGQFDYWRAYGKAVTDQEMLTGNWSYSSVVAATPASEQVFGQIFLDLDGDGKYTEGVDELYTGRDVTVSLNNVNGGIITGRDYFKNHDGYLQILTDPLDQDSNAFLAGGNYTVSAELAGSNKDYVISTTVPTDVHSNGHDAPAVWANDFTAEDTVVKPIVGADDIGVNAGGIFTVENKAPIMHYFGIALKPVVKAKFNIKKDLGRTWKANDSFRFTVSAAEGTPLPATKIYNIGSDTPGKQVTTGDITFDKVGDYTYTITEDKAGTTAEGITYDADPKTVTVTVERDAESTVPGKLKATVTYSDAAAGAAVFMNTYAATGKAVISGTKSFKFSNGTDIAQAGGEFSFKLEPVSARAADGTEVAPVPMPSSDTAANTSDGTFSFGEITYGKAGTYTYKVSETAGSDTTVTYDDTVYTVTVTAADKLDGTLTCTSAFAKTGGAAADSLAFANVRGFEPAAAVVEAVKKLHGRNLVDGEFTFRLDPKEGAPVTGEADHMEAVNEGTSVTFDEITFAAPGTYKYSLKEVKPAQADRHMDYSTDEVTVKVDVALDTTTTNQLKATVLYDDAAKKHTFINTFNADPITANIGVKKTLDGREWIDNDRYSFNLAAGENNTATKPDGTAAGIDTPMPAEPSVELTKDSTPVDGDQHSRTGLFGNITFPYAGVYNYTITETEGQIGGITYDTNTINVTVTVTADDTTGALEAAVSYGGDAGFAAFTNLYTVESVDLVLGGTKTLTTRDGTAKTVNNGQFKFKIEPQGDAPESASAEVYNDENANFAFGAISFTEAGEFTYKVSEVAGTNPTIEYDTAEYTYVVTVTDNLEGTLSVAVKDETGAEIEADAYLTHAAFANIYNYDPIDVDLDVTKVLAGRALQAEEFSFRLTGAAGYPMPEGADTPEGSTLQEKTAVNDAGGKVDFGSIRYEMPGTYRYHITEMIPDDADKLDNVTYDTTDFEVLVNVSQLAGATELVAQITYNGETKAEFSNVYTPVPVTAEISVSKTLEGRAWTDNDSFDFTIEGSGNENVTDSEGNPVVIDNPMPETATLTITKGADEAAAYSGAFGEISFAYEGVYHYAITETKGQAAGVTYDDSVIEVEVRVTADEATGALSAEVVYPDGAAAAEVGRDGKTFVFGKGAWSNAVWARKESLEIKDALDRLAGGKMPSRVDTCVRLAQSVWESQDGKERVIFLFNLDFDNATDVRLTEDGAFRAERMGKDGSWTPLGTGGRFTLPPIPAWSVAVLRLTRDLQ